MASFVQRGTIHRVLLRSGQALPNAWRNLAGSVGIVIRAAYIRCMARMTTHPRNATGRPARRSAEMVVPKRVPKGRKSDTIQVQWSDGAGELNYDELTPAQSWPFLRDDRS